MSLSRPSPPRKSSPRPLLRASDVHNAPRVLAPVGPSTKSAALAAAAALVLACGTTGCSKSSASAFAETSEPTATATARASAGGTATSDAIPPSTEEHMLAGAAPPPRPDVVVSASPSADAKPAASTAKVTTPHVDPPRPPGGMRPSRDPLNSF
jgi:hypothetical protein